jgi:signal peptidase I
MHTTATYPRSRGGASCLRLVDCLVLLVCAGVLVQTFALEPFQVPTGSMAPALIGQHRVCTCPRCGTTVAVGRSAADRNGRGGARAYARTYCPNCGETPLPAGELAETAGDHVLVNKAAFALRQPRRWEVVVFRLFGIVLIKRVVALPGETVLVEDGDVTIDGQLVRKTFAQAWAMRVPIFEQSHRPPSGWAERWEGQPDDIADGPELRLDGKARPQALTYRSGPQVAGKYPVLRDEYAYNAGVHPGSEPVHDFLIEADVELLAGQGTFALRLCDGQDWVEVSIPSGRSGAIATRSWAVDAVDPSTTWTRESAGAVLQPGRTYHVIMMFVDRRVGLSVDGRCLVQDVDLPAPSTRSGVGRPVQLEAAGATFLVRDFRLYRDVHYASRGRTAVSGEPVRLGVEQYFVLGDNSANSDDSRFWPPNAVSEAQLLGPAFLVHLPSRLYRWHGGECQVPDFNRIRWIR